MDYTELEVEKILWHTLCKIPGTPQGATVTVLRAASGRGHEATRQRPAHSARGAEPLGSDRTNPPSPAEPIRSTPTKPLELPVAFRPGGPATGGDREKFLAPANRFNTLPPAHHWHLAVARLSCSIAWSSNARRVGKRVGYASITTAYI